MAVEVLCFIKALECSLSFEFFFCGLFCFIRVGFGKNCSFGGIVEWVFFANGFCLF